MIRHHALCTIVESPHKTTLRYEQLVVRIKRMVDFSKHGRRRADEATPHGPRAAAAVASSAGSPATGRASSIGARWRASALHSGRRPLLAMEPYGPGRMQSHIRMASGPHPAAMGIALLHSDKGCCRSSYAPRAPHFGGQSGGCGARMGSARWPDCACGSSSRESRASRKRNLVVAKFRVPTCSEFL